MAPPAITEQNNNRTLTGADMSETVQLIPHQDSPRCIRLHEADNVAVVANDGGVPVGARQ